MKMRLCLFFAVALSFLATACVEDIQNDTETTDKGSKMVTEKITAVNGDANTKAAVDADAKFTWSAGDQIAVHVSDGKYYTTDELAAGGSINAEFSVSYPAGSSRDYYAIFPAFIVDADNYGQSTLNVILPNSYTLAQVSGTATPCPMIAVNAPGSGWTFKQLCGLLRLTVNSIPASTSYLKIDFNGMKVQGTFSIASPVNPDASDPSDLPVIETSATTGADDIITITDLGISSWTNGMVLNLPLPTGNYTKVTVTAYNSSDIAILTITRPFKSSGAYTAARAKGRKLTAALPYFSLKSKRVTFAPGNLQATYNSSSKTWAWSFAEHQYDCIGNASGNTTISTYLKEDEAPFAVLSPDGTDGTVDLFGRSTANTYYGLSKSTTQSEYDGTFNDWGTLATISYKGITYPTNYWRTFTGNTDNDAASNEWSWIMNKRTTGGTVNEITNARYTKATITVSSDPLKTVNGIILFPDGYAEGTPEGVVWGTINGRTANWDTSCTKSGWEALEAAGCVFLPAAGYRSGNSVSSVNVEGYYWVNELRYSGNADLLNFYNGQIKWNWAMSFSKQYSVRLVHDIN